MVTRYILNLNVIRIEIMVRIKYGCEIYIYNYMN